MPLFIDPLREPMETTVFLGSKPDKIVRDADGRIIDNLSPQLKLSTPIMFSAMIYPAYCQEIPQSPLALSKGLWKDW